MSLSDIFINALMKLDGFTEENILKAINLANNDIVETLDDFIDFINFNIEDNRFTNITHPFKDSLIKKVVEKTIINEDNIVHYANATDEQFPKKIFSEQVEGISLLKYKGKNVSDQLPQKTKKIEEWDYDYLPAIVTLMAMVTFDYNSLRGLLFFVLLILFLFLIFAQTTTFYNSALYKAVGLKIYQVDFDNLENCKIITFHKLNGGTTVSLKHIKGNIYFSL